MTEPHGLRQLGRLTSPELARRAAVTLVVVPVGSTEQHGPHLPLSTDTEVAAALAGRLAEARPDVLVAPPVSYGSSGEHAGFVGTLSVGGPVLEAVLVELGRSADAFAGLVFVSAHGGNARPVARAVARLVAEGRLVRAWSPGDGAGRAAGDAVGRGDAHAGFTETSVMLALDPGAVRLDRAGAGCRAPLAELMPVLVASGVAAVSPNGVLGDPAGASAATGRDILDGWAGDLIAALQGWP